MGRIRFRLTLAVVPVAVGVMLSATPGFAQGTTRYPTPALSPWFNLYNKQGGPVDNYNMFVRPQMQLRNTLQTQQADIQQQATGATAQAQQISQMEEDRRGVAATGAPAGFMNHGRYFGLAASTGQGGLSGSAPRIPPKTARKDWTLPPANTHSGGK